MELHVVFYGIEYVARPLLLFFSSENRRFQGVEVQADWLEDTDEEIDEQELEAHYSYMAKIQEVPTTDSETDTEPLEKVQYDAEYNVFANERQHSEHPESINNTCVVEKVDSNVIPNSPDMCDNDIQTHKNAKECDDECAALANLIANLTLYTKENKNILKQVKKANASLTQELKESKSNLEESNTTRDSCLITLQSKQTELETYKTLNNRIVDYDKLERKLNENLGLLAQKEIDIKEGLVKEKTKVITDLKLNEEKDLDKLIAMEKKLMFLNEIVYKRNQSIQAINMLAPKGLTFNGRPTFANPMYLKKAQSKKPCLYEILYDTSNLENVFAPDREETLTLEKENAYNEFQCIYVHKVKECECLAEKLFKQTKNVSKEVYNGLLRSFAKLEKHSISLELALQKCQEQLKNDTVCKENASTVFLKEREQYHEIQYLKAQLQDKNIAISVFNSNHDARVSKFLNDVNARSKKPQEVPNRTRKPKRKANKSVATPPKKIVALESTIQKSKSYYRMLYEKTSKAWKWWTEQQCPLGYKWVPKTKMKWVPKVRNKNVKKRVMFAIDNASRITNVLKLINTLGSNLSSIPSSSNSLADYSTHPIHS
ncbi:hypothetical protein Tco_0285755 [Tanacetum coccineum]